MSQAGAGGEVGTTTAGAGGDLSASAGAGGQGALACTPSGATESVSFDPEVIYQGCRGAIVVAKATVGTSTAPEFTCCAVPDSIDTISIELSGYSNGDGTASLGFYIPEDTQLGAHSLAMTCSDGLAQNTIALNVNDDVAPVVTSLTPPLNVDQDLTIDGTDLTGVTTVTAVADGGDIYPCEINTQTSSATQLACNFGVDLAVGDYSVSVFSDRCGYTLKTLSFTILPRL